MLDLLTLWFGIGLILRIIVAILQKIENRKQATEGYEKFLLPWILVIGPIFLLIIIALFISNVLGLDNPKE